MTAYASAIKSWLTQCPYIQSDKMFFNFLSVEDGSQAFLTSETYNRTKDIVGNESGVYEFSIADFRELSGEALSYNDTDLQEFADVSNVAEWIEAQDEAKNYPDFGADTIINSITCPPSPSMAGADKSMDAPMAKYVLKVSINYDKFKS